MQMIYLAMTRGHATQRLVLVESKDLIERAAIRNQPATRLATSPASASVVAAVFSRSAENIRLMFKNKCFH